MKKLCSLLICILFLTFILSGCASTKVDANHILGYYVPGGYYDCYENEFGEFQDFTYYDEYYYGNSIPFSSNKEFSVVSEQDVDKLCQYVDNHKQLFSDDYFADVKYSLNTDIIKKGDYFKLIDKGMHYNDFIFDNYDLYYFDNNTMILYYIHNNI